MANLLKLSVHYAKINVPRQYINRLFIAPTVSQFNRIQQYANGKNLKSNMVNRKVLESRSKIDPCKIPSYPNRPTNCVPKSSVESSTNLSNTQGNSRCNVIRQSSTNEPPPSKKPNTLWLLLVAAAAGGAGLIYYLMNTDQDSEKVAQVQPIEEQEKRLRIPAESSEIPKEVPYLLIGGGTASFSAFRAIKSNDPKAKVMVITNESQIPYMRPPLSKEMWLNAKAGEAVNAYKFKQWNGAERSLFYEPDDFYTIPSKLLNEENGGVTIVRGYSVKKIDVCEQTAFLSDGTAIRYGECLLATGSEPKNLQIFEAAPINVKKHISMYKTIGDFEKLKSVVDQSKSVAIIGGGFLGSELSCALAKYGQANSLRVYQVFHENGNMGKVLPEYLSKWTTERVREEGVDVMVNSQIKSVDVHENQLKLSLNNGTSLLVDHVIVAVGSQPNVQLANESGLEVDSNLGGYVVNAELEARRHLYVAGDAACFYDPKLGRRRVEHHDHAVVSGRLAGENMVGQKKPYKHQSMFWSDLGANVGYEAIGLVDSSLPTFGIFAKPSPRPLNASNHLDNETNDKIHPTENEQKSSIPSSSSQEQITTLETKPNSTQNDSGSEDNYGKGVVFYLRDDIVVGILLWNVFNRINIARVIVSEGKKYDNLNEVAKLFDLHS